MATNNKFNNTTEFEFCGDFQVGFTVLPNYILNEETISAKALGIYAKILQYQNAPNHVITVKGLVSFFKDGRDSINNGIKELISFGYLKREKRQNEKGQFEGWKYVVYVKPNLDVEPITTENGKSVIGKSEVGKHVNNKENSKINKILNNNNTNKSSSSIEEREEENINKIDIDKSKEINIEVAADTSKKDTSKNNDNLNTLVTLCQNLNFKLKKADMKSLLIAYSLDSITKAIMTITSTSTFENNEIKNHRAYLLKTLNEMNTVKVENKNITVNNTINNEVKKNNFTDYSGQRDYGDCKDLEKQLLGWDE